MNRLVLTFISLLIVCFSVNICFSEEIEMSQQPDYEVNSAEQIKELPYNYLDTKSIPIRLTVTKEISTEFPVPEGSTVDLRVVHDVYERNTRILKQGDIITGKVETIITSGMNGFPAEIILDDFNIPYVKNSQLLSVYTKKGQNRCFWVYPLKWSLTLIPFVGSLTNLIMGGHARIKPDDIITIYYFPNWK